MKPEVTPFSVVAEMAQDSGSRVHGAVRYVPLALLAAGLGACLVSDLHDYLSFDVLARHREALMAYVQAHAAAAALAFVALYAAATALSIPGATVLTLLGGFLFGTWFGAVCVVLGATLGAVAVFLAARSALGPALHRRAGPWLGRFAEGFRRDAFSYLLVLRLVPLVPFWLVNLVPAFLGVSLRAYALATLIGIAPASVIYASVGNGLGGVLDAGRTPDLAVILEPRILLPLLGLAALALLPVAWRRFKGGSLG